MQCSVQTEIAEMKKLGMSVLNLQIIAVEQGVYKLSLFLKNINPWSQWPVQICLFIVHYTTTV